MKTFKNPQTGELKLYANSNIYRADVLLHRVRKIKNKYNLFDSDRYVLQSEKAAKLVFKLQSEIQQIMNIELKF